MSYQVLARKYRPQKFSDVIGQEHVTQTLKNAIAQERIAHGYIFSGHRGIGKTTVARILAMALNCRSSAKPVQEPCGICDSCTEIRAGNSVDVIEIDAATNRGIDEIRELREAARYLPARDRFKIYILDEAHQITDAAFNALLKTLEEPPSHVVFMLATTQPEDIPQTIRSRCQHFSFRAVKFEDILGQLRDLTGRENIPADEDALALLAEAGDGSIRDALSILDQAIASTAEHLTLESVRQLIGAAPATALEGVMQSVAESASEKVLLLVDGLISEGHSPAHFARQLVRFLRNVTVAKIAGKDSALLQISEDERKRAARIAELVQRRGSGAAFPNHAAHARRAGIPAGSTLPPRAWLAEDVARATSAAAGTVAQRRRAVLLRAPRARGRPMLAPTPEVRRTEPPALARPSSVSPFAADTARKNTPKAESAGEISATTARVGAANAGANVVIMGSAAPAVEEVAPEPRVAPKPEVSVTADALRDVALNALSHQPMLVSMLQAAEWSLEGNSIVARVASSTTMIDMSFTSDARRIATAAVSGAAGKPLKMQVLPGGTAQAASPIRRTTSNGVGNGTARSRAEQDPIVQQMQEKFGAEIRTVIDYQEKGRE